MKLEDEKGEIVLDWFKRVKDQEYQGFSDVNILLEELKIESIFYTQRKVAGWYFEVKDYEYVGAKEAFDLLRRLKEKLDYEKAEIIIEWFPGARDQGYIGTGAGYDLLRRLKMAPDDYKRTKIIVAWYKEQYDIPNGRFYESVTPSDAFELLRRLK